MVKIVPYEPAFAGPESDNALFTVKDSNEVLNTSAKANAFHLWALGITTVMGGMYYGWNVALVNGFGYYIVIQTLMGLAYICYVCCAAEIIATIAFSGGAYGLSRVVLGFYPGFIIGCMELLEYTAMTSVSVIFIARQITDAMQCTQGVEPVIWLFTYVAMLSICSRKKLLWASYVILAALSILPVVVYCLAALNWTNFERYASLHSSAGHSDWFTGSFSTAFMTHLPYTTWAYAGIESLSLMTSMTVQPKLTFARGVIPSTITLFVCNTFLVFAMASMPPGILSTASLSMPLSNAFEMMFGWKESSYNLLLLPAQFGMAIGFVVPYGKVMQSMADSNLLPPILGLQGQRSINKATLLGSVIGYAWCGFGVLIPNVNAALQNVCVFAATLTYMAQITGFIMLRTRFASASREFYSPLGVPGAVFAGLVYMLLQASIIGFQNDHCVAFASVCLILVALSTYYFSYARPRQTLSSEEYKSIFTFSVINFNRRKFSKRNGSSALRRRLKALLLTPIKRYIRFGFLSPLHARLSSAARNYLADSGVLSKKGIPGDVSTSECASVHVSSATLIVLARHDTAAFRSNAEGG
jgi:amino acid transporter